MPNSSEHQKLLSMLAMYERILHPDIFNALIKQLNAAYDENKKQAYAEAKISDEALLIEKKLFELKKSIEQHKDFPDMKTFYFRIFYKDLLKIFNHAK